MAKWLEQASQWHELYSHDLDHKFEARSDRTWGAWYFCPKSYMNLKYNIW